MFGQSRDGELHDLIDATPWVDTHEHIVEERERLRPAGYAFTMLSDEHIAVPADWSALLVDYSLNDLVAAGLSLQGLQHLQSFELSALEKWNVAEAPLERARNSGYLRAVDLTTERLLELRLSRDTCEEIDAGLRALRVEGYYTRLLRDVANVTRCHVNTLEADPFCETGSPGLLLQDLGIAPLVRGYHAPAERASGIEVDSLADYLRVIEWCFERYGPRAVAVKCVWAYQREMAVCPPDTPPRREFERVRAGSANQGEQRQVEDFLFQRCLELATDAHLPVKIHLGYLDGMHSPQFAPVFDHVRDVVDIVQRNPTTTFVLMHTAWPQQEQLLALAKHHPNVVLDLCWAWILAPLATRDFLQRALTTIPATNLLCFGGDYIVAENVVGHAEIARRGLQSALQRLVEDEWLTSAWALELVPLLMHGNADRIFPVPGEIGVDQPSIDA